MLQMIERRTLQAGMETDLTSPHSLRAGFITEASRQGIPLLKTMALSDHKKAAIATRYHCAGGVLRSRGGQGGRLTDPNVPPTARSPSGKLYADPGPVSRDQDSCHVLSHELLVPSGHVNRAVRGPNFGRAPFSFIVNSAILG